MKTGEKESTISDIGRQYLKLQAAEQVGPVRVQSLLARFQSIDRIFAASLSELERVEGIGPVTARAIVQARKHSDHVEREIEAAADCGARILCFEDPEYPAPLKHIPDPPICLYIRGTYQPTDAVSIGIVGTRRCSHYGKEQAVRFAELLARAGFTVVSGLARGVDGHAHRGALRGGGRTLASLGNGLSNIYPPEHEELAEEIAAHGALISELPIDTPPDAKNFPGRNRIIAGLCLGVLVVEAGHRSGALITARHAVEYNREAFALPGNVDRPEFCAGANALIRNGTAKLVTCLDDILEELGDVGRTMNPNPSEFRQPAAKTARLNSRPSPIEGGLFPAGQDAVYDAILSGAEDVDAICETTGLDAGVVAATLTRLQLSGSIRRLPGNRFAARTPAASS